MSFSIAFLKSQNLLLRMHSQLNDEKIRIMNRIPLFAYLTNTVDLRFYHCHGRDSRVHFRIRKTTFCAFRLFD